MTKYRTQDISVRKACLYAKFLNNDFHNMEQECNHLTNTSRPIMKHTHVSHVNVTEKCQMIESVLI